MDTQLKAVVAAAVLWLAAAGHANALLIDRGFGLIYDSDQDITWMQDARYCRFGLDPACQAAGLLGNLGTRGQAVAFADALVYAGFDDWRLPATGQPDPTCSQQDLAGVPGESGGLNCTGSEMGYLYYVYGIQGGGGVEHADAGPFLRFAANPGPFQNIVTGTFSGDFASFIPAFYWSGTESAAGGNGFVFTFNNGNQGIAGVENFRQVWVVRDGDVGQLPVPATVFLFLAGLLGLALASISRIPGPPGTARVKR